MTLTPTMSILAIVVIVPTLILAINIYMHHNKGLLRSKRLLNPKQPMPESYTCSDGVTFTKTPKGDYTAENGKYRCTAFELYCSMNSKDRKKHIQPSQP